MPKMTTCLWFDNEAQEAARFYCSVFKGSKLLETTYYGENMHKPKGTVLTVRFRLLGQEFLALNGGNHYKPNPSVSFMVPCKTQKEIDHYWKKLTDGGEEIQCGWLNDKFGFAWQVFPAFMGKMVASKDKVRSGRVMQAMMPMKKLILKDLKAAWDGK